jgi:transcriptional regulator with XRE-family HTH domain
MYKYSVPQFICVAISMFFLYFPPYKEVEVAMDRGNKALADLVKNRRESFGLSQEDVADSMNMSLRAFQYLESGKTKITADKEVKLMRIMRSLYVKKTGLFLDEEKDNESIASQLKDLFLGLLRG